MFKVPFSEGSPEEGEPLGSRSFPKRCQVFKEKEEQNMDQVIQAVTFFGMVSENLTLLKVGKVTSCGIDDQ